MMGRMDDDVVNVLAGIPRRDEPMVEVLPRTQVRWINATFQVDMVALAHCRGRALLEGTSVNSLLNRLLAEYSGIYPPPPEPAVRPSPRKRVRMTDNSYR